MTLVEAYRQGVRDARTKLAGPMGADIGVAPRGDEQSHGTETIPYPSGRRETTDHDKIDRLWDLFGKGREAPGGTGGQYGTETIG